GPGLSDEEADRYLDEMSQIAVLLGADPDAVPRTKSALGDYLRSRELTATPPAKEAMRFVLYPPVPWPEGRFPEIPLGRLAEIPGRAAYSVLSLATIAILPARVRRAYRLPWVPVTPPLKASVFAVTRAMSIVMPPPPRMKAALEQHRLTAA
ncbi:MAG TPA: oxygenase MpaB family protein, partial [Actinomycetota bacterium]|nr:oxygenase MpaB family protein [Actinomycetota bacterium]